MKKIMILLFTILFIISCSPAPDIPAAEISDAPVVDTEEMEVEMAEEEITTEPEESVQVEADEETKDTEETSTVKKISSDSTFSFTGYKPGRDHTGTFDSIDGELTFSNNKITKVEMTVQVDSLKVEPEKLRNHLLSDDFFDQAQFATIHAVSTEIREDEITGMLTFHGVTKEITFPAEITENSISTDFLLDTTPFGMRYVGVDKDVRIQFMMKVE